MTGSGDPRPRRTAASPRQQTPDATRPKSGDE
jgi:hypothetical protein